MIRLEGTWTSGPGIVIATPHVSHLDGPLLAACLPEPILWGWIRNPWRPSPGRRDFG